MYKSILQFCKTGIPSLNEISDCFFENPTDIAGFVGDVQAQIIRLGCDFLSEMFTMMDDMIRESSLRKQSWEIVRRDRKTMITSLGTIEFHKTMYKHKKTGERTCLLDRVLEIGESSRISEDVEAQLLAEAVQTSYSRTGNAVSFSDSVSKSTVKNKLHALEFPKQELAETDRKQVKYLYIDADGGNWITAGKRAIHGIITVLDEYHLNRYLTGMTSHLWDSKEDGKVLLKENIKNGTKKDFEHLS